MEHLPMPEKSDSRGSVMDRMGAKIEKRMEKGNLSLIVAAILPLVNFACMPVISVVELAGFAIYELLLVAGVAWGTKQYYRLYSLPRQKYPVELHLPVICLCGLGAGVMVVIPAMWYVVLILWAVSLVFSLVRQLALGSREQIWNEYTVAFAIAVRAGYLASLAVCLLVMAAYLMIRQIS